MGSGVNATGKIALAFRTPACDNFERVYSAQKAGAAGLIIITSEDQILKPFYCSGDECNVPISIPGTMIECGLAVCLRAVCRVVSRAFECVAVPTAVKVVKRRLCPLPLGVDLFGI